MADENFGLSNVNSNNQTPAGNNTGPAKRFRFGACFISNAGGNTVCSGNPSR